MVRTFWISILLLLAGFSLAQAPVDEAKKTLDNMLNQVNALKTLAFTLTTEERIEGEMSTSYTDGKIQFTPYQCYFRTNKTGAEILYKTGHNENKALIAPHSFPYFNVSLDPYSYFMRNNRHHTIMQGGFRYFAQVLGNLVNDTAHYQNTTVVYEEDVDTLGRSFKYLSLTFREFDWISYTVMDEKSVVEIARKYNLHDYMIVEKNNLDDFEDIDAGDIIQIPTLYCQRIDLWIDPEQKLPWLTTIYDEHGLWSSYLYHNIVLNPNFSEEVFSADNPNYGF